jgi:hypothetical protein
MTTINFREPYSESVVRTEFQHFYRDLEIKKDVGYSLYYIVPPRGRKLPAFLACRFTKLMQVQRNIDRFNSENPEGLQALENISWPEEPKRSHHKKPVPDSTNVEQDTTEPPRGFVDSDDYREPIAANPLYQGPASA